eukprot:923268-Amphidinium_carterae.1
MARTLASSALGRTTLVNLVTMTTHIVAGALRRWVTTFPLSFWAQLIAVVTMLLQVQLAVLTLVEFSIHGTAIDT